MSCLFPLESESPSLKFSKFPVNFPVSREIAPGDRFRSTASATTQSAISGFAGDIRERPAIGGEFLSLFSRSPSLRADSGHFGAQSPVQKFPFLGDLLGAGSSGGLLSAGTQEAF